MNPLRYHVVLADGYAPLSNAAEDHGGQLPAKPAHPHGSVFFKSFYPPLCSEFARRGTARPPEVTLASVQSFSRSNEH
jgi:hypothetical protein